jgi:hypothetical protein
MALAKFRKVSKGNQKPKPKKEREKNENKNS